MVFRPGRGLVYGLLKSHIPFESLLKTIAGRCRYVFNFPNQFSLENFLGGDLFQSGSLRYFDERPLSI
jgi:hypothetical protein